jgi:hypothetical protein
MPAADLVITSPPYYGMRTYRPDQWLRNWLLGGLPSVDYGMDGQLSHTSPAAFEAELHQVWLNVAGSSKRGAHLVCRFGGIRDRRAEPLTLVKNSLAATPWRLTTVRSAGDARRGRRQASQFRAGAMEIPHEEHDLYAVLE